MSGSIASYTDKQNQHYRGCQMIVSIFRTLFARQEIWALKWSCCSLLQLGKGIWPKFFRRTCSYLHPPQILLLHCHPQQVSHEMGYRQRLHHQEDIDSAQNKNKSNRIKQEKVQEILHGPRQNPNPWCTWKDCHWCGNLYCRQALLKPPSLRILGPG